MKMTVIIKGQYLMPLIASYLLVKVNMAYSSPFSSTLSTLYKALK